MHACKAWSGTWEARLASLVSEDRPYKPMVKWGGGKRESEGAVVVRIGVHQNAPGAKGPRFDRASRGRKRKVMSGRSIRSNHPAGYRPGVAVASQMVPGAPRGGNARETQGELSVAAKCPLRRRPGAIWFRRDDSPRTACSAAYAGGRVAAPGRSSVSRVRENRTHGLKGESGNGLA